MSYIEQISNYRVIFKDEKSYLNARLENLELYPDVPFIGFLKNEMYNKEKCEVESIIPTSIFYSNLTTTGDFVVSNIINNGNENVYSETVIPNSNGDIYYVTADMSIGGVNDGQTFTLHNTDSNIFFDPLSFVSFVKSEEEECKDIIKKDDEEPDDPIESRFDILDL